MKITTSQLQRIIREEILEVMPKKSPAHKRKVRRDYDREKQRAAARERAAPQHSLKAELDKQYAPLKSLSHGIYEDFISSAEDDPVSGKNKEEVLRAAVVLIDKLRQLLDQAQGEELAEDEESAEQIYQLHKSKQDNKSKKKRLRKELCPECPKCLQWGSLISQLNNLALAMKGKVGAEKKS